MLAIKSALPQIEEPLTLHCFDPWMIMKAKPNQEAKAKESLTREGFEVYYGEWRETIAVTIPAKKINSKLRYRRRSEQRTIERVRPVYPGYLFVRRLFGCFDLFRAYDLVGVLGLCCFGNAPATLPDYVIELIRLAEARGYFRDGSDVIALDQQRYSAKASDVRTAERQRAREEWDKVNGVVPPKAAPRQIGRLDESGRTILFIEEFGQITRVITSREAAGSGRQAGVPPQVRSLRGFL